MSGLSTTRALIAELRHKLGASVPMAPPAPPAAILPPPARVFPRPSQANTRFAQAAAAHTTALVGIGAVGTRYATDVLLQFQAELAVAHGAVATVLPPEWAESQGLLPLASRVTSHREFLLRPDLGRRLDDASSQVLRSRAAIDVDVQPILADGLSAVACMGAGPELLRSLIAECEGLGLRVGTPVCARFARVWLQDEIGQTTRAKVAVILLGERPGLGTGDGLSGYVVYEPAVGKTDGDRNMISNIHARGMLPVDAGRRLARLAQGMIRQGVSGVNLDLSAISGLDGAGGTALRAPQVRQRLVETP